MLTIGRANANDAESIRRLMENLEAPQEFPREAFQRNYLQNLADPAIVYLVAHDGVQIVAFGSLHISTPLHHVAPVAEIVELVVDEQCRGGGIGARIIDAMISIARDKACCSLEVASNRTRNHAHRFYAAHGFMLTHLKLTMSLNTGGL